MHQKHRKKLEVGKYFFKKCYHCQNMGGLKFQERKLSIHHLLTSPENQEKIRKADEISRKKEEKAMEKQGLIKKLIADDKKSKKKVTCRADTVQARSLPARCRGGGRGGRGGRGRLCVRGTPKL